MGDYVVFWYMTDNVPGWSAPDAARINGAVNVEVENVVPLNWGNLGAQASDRDELRGLLVDALNNHPGNHFTAVDQPAANGAGTIQVTYNTQGAVQTPQMLPLVDVLNDNFTFTVDAEGRNFEQGDRGDRLWSSTLWTGLGNETRALVPQTARYYLKLFNAVHSEQLPRSFEVSIHALTQGWEEGNGLDLIGYVHQDEASWSARISTRIAQVITVQLDSDNSVAYQNNSISIYDGQNNKFNFFFQTALNESESGIASGTDVAVDLRNIAQGATILTVLRDAISAQPGFTTALAADNEPGAFPQHIVVTNNTPGEADEPSLSDGAPVVFSTTTAGANNTSWSTPGGAFLDSVDIAPWNYPEELPDPEPAQPAVFTQTFELGTEDLEIDITNIVVRHWMEEALEVEASNGPNVDGDAQDARGHAGLIIKLSPQFESGANMESYYTKRFFARDSEFFFKRPVIEARWNSSVQDDIGRLRNANPHQALAASQLSTYYYNRVDGQLTDFPQDGGNDVVPSFALTTDPGLLNVVSLAAGQGPFMRGLDGDFKRNNTFGVQITNAAVLKFDVDNAINRSTGYMRILIDPAGRTLVNNHNHIEAEALAAHKIHIYWREDPGSFDLAPKIDPATGEDRGGYALDVAHSDEGNTSIIVRVGQWNKRFRKGSSVESAKNRLISAMNLINAINDLAGEYYHAELGSRNSFPVVNFYTKEVQPTTPLGDLATLLDGNDDIILAYRPAPNDDVEHVRLLRPAPAPDFVLQNSWDPYDPAAPFPYAADFMDNLLTPEYDACASAADPAACRVAARVAAFGNGTSEVSEIAITGNEALGQLADLQDFYNSYWYFTVSTTAGQRYNFHFASVDLIGFQAHPNPPDGDANTTNILVDINAPGNNGSLLVAMANAISSVDGLSAVIGAPTAAALNGFLTGVIITADIGGPTIDIAQVTIPGSPLADETRVATAVQGSLPLELFDFSEALMAGQIGTNDPTSVDATRVSEGVYRADFIVPTNVLSSTLYEKWELGGELLKGHNGSHSARLKQWHEAKDEIKLTDLYSLSVTNLEASYTNETSPRFNVFVKPRNRKPNVVSRNLGNVTGLIIPSIYYSLHRVSDGTIVIPFGTGVDDHTLLSYDDKGSYFDLDMSMLEEGYSYGIKFAFLINGTLEEQPDVFRFRVE